RLIQAYGEEDLAVGTERDRPPDLGWMLQYQAKWLAGRGVPEPRRLVPAPGEHGLAVGAECHSTDVVVMLHGRADEPAGGDVPEAYPAVRVSGDESLAVGAERDGPDLGAMGLQAQTERLPGRDLREPRRAVRTYRQHGPTVGAERQSRRLILGPDLSGK